MIDIILNSANGLYPTKPPPQCRKRCISKLSCHEILDRIPHAQVFTTGFLSFCSYGSCTRWPKIMTFHEHSINFFLRSLVHWRKLLFARFFCHFLWVFSAIALLNLLHQFTSILFLNVVSTNNLYGHTIQTKRYSDQV